MYRGTTPTFTFTLPDEVDLTLAENVYVTFAKMNETIIFTKDKDDEDIEIIAHSVEVYLTQEETLALPIGQVKVQLNWLYDDDGVTKRACSNKAVIQTSRNLIDEVLEIE